MLTKTNVVDLVTQNESTGIYQVVLIIEDNEWSLPNVRSLLQEKANTYLNYVLDGQMRSDYPDSDRAGVEMIIHFGSPPPAEVSGFVDRLLAAINSEGVHASVVPF